MFLNSEKVTFNSTRSVLIHFQHRVERASKLGNRLSKFNFKLFKYDQYFWKH